MTPTPQPAPFITASDAASLRAFVKAAEVALASAPPAPIQERRAIQELGTEFLVSKARGGKSPRYLLSVRSDLSKVFRGQMLREAHTITTAELEAWTSGDWTPRYRRNLITTLRTVFNFAKLRGYVGSNPAQAIELPHADDKPVEIQTPDQVRVVLHTAQRLDAGVARLLAVEYFGGLRSAEAMRLAESEIGPRYVEVKAEKCKTRRRPLVTISATLRAKPHSRRCLLRPSLSARRAVLWARLLPPRICHRGRTPPPAGRAPGAARLRDSERLPVTLLRSRAGRLADRGHSDREPSRAQGD